MQHSAESQKEVPVNWLKHLLADDNMKEVTANYQKNRQGTQRKETYNLKEEELECEKCTKDLSTSS